MNTLHLKKHHFRVAFFSILRACKAFKEFRSIFPAYCYKALLTEKLRCSGNQINAFSTELKCFFNPPVEKGLAKLEFSVLFL